MAVAVTVVSLALSIAVATASCVWTSTHCACSKKEAVGSAGKCFDPVGRIGAINSQQSCTPRSCNSKYVCDCNGPSYCKLQTSVQKFLTPVTNRVCQVKQSNITRVALDAEDINTVLSAGPHSGACVFNDSACTCSTTT
jgi:hypothetical protein